MLHDPQSHPNLFYRYNNVRRILQIVKSIMQPFLDSCTLRPIILLSTQVPGRPVCVFLKFTIEGRLHRIIVIPHVT